MWLAWLSCWYWERVTEILPLYRGIQQFSQEIFDREKLSKQFFLNGVSLSVSFFPASQNLFGFCISHVSDRIFYKPCDQYVIFCSLENENRLGIRSVFNSVCFWHYHEKKYLTKILMSWTFWWWHLILCKVLRKKLTGSENVWESTSRFEIPVN